MSRTEQLVAPQGEVEDVGRCDFEGRAGERAVRIRA